MLTLKELRFSGIGRFVEEQRISFDTLGNLIQVDGKNNNTGGSSGAAKSTIFNALDFLFGINKLPNSLLQSRLTDETIQVEGVFDCDGLPLTITRGKKLKIDFNGEVTTGSSKISEEKLDQILAIPRHLFKPMLHKEQGERGFFLNFTPKQTNDFLTDCLGLGNFKGPLLALDIRLTELEKKRGSLSNTVSMAEASLKACRDAQTSIGEPPIKEVDRDAILALKANMEATTKELNALLAVQSVEITELEQKRPAQVLIKFDRCVRTGLETKLQATVEQRNAILVSQKELENKVQSEIQSIKLRQGELSRLIEKGNTAKSQAVELTEKVQKLRNAECHTCGQHWATDAAKTEEEQLIYKISQLKTQVVTGGAAALELETTKTDMDLILGKMPTKVPSEYQEFLLVEGDLKKQIEEDIKAEYVHNDSVNSTNMANQFEFNAQLQLLRNRHASDQAQFRERIDAYRKGLDIAALKLRTYEEARTRYETTFNKLRDQEREHDTKFAEASQELTKIVHDIESYEELKKAVKSYLSCSFDEALETIGENATKLVRNVPNMANATIQLTGVWETKEGKVREEVNAVLNLDGDENVDIRSLCGGERSAIDLAVDLSVIELIENKTNRGINIMVLDEPFTGLDTVCIEMALEVLKSASSSKKLIIVDHNPEIKEMVESSILVVRDGSTSKILQN